jgi:hypothetical protein
LIKFLFNRATAAPQTLRFLCHWCLDEGERQAAVDQVGRDGLVGQRGQPEQVENLEADQKIRKAEKYKFILKVEVGRARALYFGLRFWGL